MASGTNPDANPASGGNPRPKGGAGARCPARKTLRPPVRYPYKDGLGTFQAFLAAFERSKPPVDDASYGEGWAAAVQVAWAVSTRSTEPAQLLAAIDAEPMLPSETGRMAYGMTTQVLMAFLAGLESGMRCRQNGGAAK